MMAGAGDCDYPEIAYDSDDDFDSTEWEPLDEGPVDDPTHPRFIEELGYAPGLEKEW